jgi:tetratricopeptide (TPR) repeat protein
MEEWVTRALPPRTAGQVKTEVMMAEANEQIDALKKQGVELARNNRLEEAKVVYGRVVAQYPEDAETWCALSTINGQMGRIDEAEECCRRALALQPDYGEAHMNMGNVMSAKGRFAEAVGHYQKVLQLDSRNTAAHCNLGYVQSALGRYDDAAASYQAAITIEPRLGAAHFNLGNLRNMQQRFAEAETAYRETIMLNPGFAGGWLNLGIVLSKQGRHHDAEKAYREALRLNPALANAHHGLGQLLHGLGRLAEAESAYREALRVKPDYEEARHDLGNVLMESDRLEEAAQCYQEVLARRPDALSHCNLGNVRLHQHRIAEAIKHYRQALALDPARVEIYNNLGNALRQQGELAEAEAVLREATGLDPDYAEAYANLGKVLMVKGGALDEALANYRRALELNPDLEPAVVGEATILEKLGEFEQAYARLAPFLEAGEPNIAMALVFASLCRPLRRCNEAIDLLERVLGGGVPRLEVSDRIPLHFALGRLLDAAGEYERAFEHYRQANDLAKAGHPFDLQAHVKRDDAVVATFSKAFMAGAPRAAQSSQRPIFIVGMPRSGTSLVEQILASHPAVFGAGELEEMHRIVGDLAARAPYPQCVATLSQDQCTQFARRYLDYIDTLAPPEALRVTDKMPSNYVHLGLITLLFPQARIIHCVRDPLDTCLSCYFQDFDERLPFSYDLSNLGSYYGEYLRLMEHWRGVLDSPWLEVRYEDLVANQEDVSRAMVEFCGLPWDDRCLRFFETQRLVLTASYDQVRQPMYSRSVGRWRHYRRQLEPLRQALGQYAASGEE